MVFLDLFAGIGGFAIGAEWAGFHFDAHYFSEVDDYAIRVYSHRFPDAIPLGDIRSIRGADLPQGEWIIAGGFPCQDISVAGKGAGLAGERSGLWYEYARLIGELRPRYAIMENVGALAFRGLDAVLGSLAEIGYDAEWQDIRASDVGAPHRRERIWIVGYPGGSGLDRLAWRRTGEKPEDGHLQLEAGDVPDADRRRCEGKRQRGLLDGERSAFGDDPRRRDCAETMANTESDGRKPRRTKSTGLEGESRVIGGGPLMAYSCLEGFQEPECEAVLGKGRGQEGGTTSKCSWWAAEPDVGRVAHGVPSLVDRLKCLGNSIVPQIAEMIFEQIGRIDATL